MEDFSEFNKEGTTLRKVQLRLVEMLVEIDKVCRNNNINYWIDFGTLLGAVRHGGFIPWDDDLDIAMPTEDLKRFKEIAPKALPDWLFFQNRTTEPAFRRISNKVRDNNSLYINYYDDFGRDYHKGMFIDIFEVVPYPTVNPKIQKPIIKWYLKTTNFFNLKQDVTFKNHMAALTFPVIRAGLHVLWAGLNLKPKNKLGYEKHFSVYGNSYTKDMVFPLKDITFEGHTFRAPADPDRYLTSIYGDYMKMPPKEKRRIHLIHVEFYNTPNNTTEQ